MTAALTFEPVTGRIGAVVGGVDLGAVLDDASVDAIRRALVRHRVLFFRGQQIERHHHEAFASRFGRLTTAHPVLPAVPEHPRVLELDGSRASGRADNWHTDITYVDRPPFASVLRAVQLPPVGGDTIWANTIAAYADLPAPWRALADAAWVVHTNVLDDVRGVGATSYERLPVAEAARIESAHPMVRVHPESGEPGLFLGAFARHIVGLSAAESAAVIGLLQQYVTRPDNCVRWTWRPGDVAFWDNRSTQHYAVYDYAGQARSMERVTLAGEAAIGLDGKHSYSIVGNADAYLSGVA